MYEQIVYLHFHLQVMYWCTMCIYTHTHTYRSKHTKGKKKKRKKECFINMTVQNYLQQFADRPQTVILQENDEKMK